MESMTFTPTPGLGHGLITNVRCFPGEQFSVSIPESIGDVANPTWFGLNLVMDWERSESGRWTARGRGGDDSVFSIAVVPAVDYVDFELSLTNASTRHWEHGFAFNCVQAGGSETIADFECRRHWVRSGGHFTRLIELPRVYSSRATVQLYSVEGAPEGKTIPFVRNFLATPENVTIEGWIAIVSEDDSNLVATVSVPTLFTFQNMEYSCIHAAPDFGAMGPGETNMALNRIYFVESTLEAWYGRMRNELEKK